MSLTPSTLLVANCHVPSLPSLGAAECYVVLNGHVRSMALVPQSASVATLPVAVEGPPQHQSCEPFALPEACAVVAGWGVDGPYTPGRSPGLDLSGTPRRDGVHLYVPPRASGVGAAGAVEADIWGEGATSPLPPKRGWFE